MRNRTLAIIIVSIMLNFTNCDTTHSPSNEKKIDATAATHIVREKVLSRALSSKNIYISKEPFKKGETIRGMAKTYNVDAFPFSWVFFIDDAPDANWEHPCRYVFVDERTGLYKVIEGKTPPDDLNVFIKIYPKD